MTVTASLAAGAARQSDLAVRTAGARDLLDTLMRAQPQFRWEWLGALELRDRAEIMLASRREFGTPYALWRDDPAAFMEQILGLTLWSLQRRIADARQRSRRTVVPSATTVGKTFVAAGLVLHHGSVWPVGTARAVTTATRMSQVQMLLWPEIKRLHGLAGLPGDTIETQWKLPMPEGGTYRVAYGLSAPKTDPVAVQGIHAPHLLIVIDEGGGIAHQLGDAFFSLVTGPDTSCVVIGNPDPDGEGTWMEDATTRDGVETIVIDAHASPNFTGEQVGLCRVCPASEPAHSAAVHLLAPRDAAETRSDHGEDSPFYQAKVRARFPKGGPSRAIPSTWLDTAVELARLGNDRPKLVLDPEGRPYNYQPEAGCWIRLGVDVAADGGDELAICRCEGDVVRGPVHVESGPALANAVDVAGKVLAQIRVAQDVALQVGSPWPVRVKVDAIGVGWGVVGILERWADEGLHDAEIVAVKVSESVEDGRAEQAAVLLPQVKRDELWLTMRAELQPDENGEQTYVLDVDNRTRAQLGTPTMGTRSNGTTFIESKKSIRKRGLKSPDRAEAALLAVYEPVDVDRRRTRSIIRAGA